MTDFDTANLREHIREGWGDPTIPQHATDLMLVMCGVIEKLRLDLEVSEISRSTAKKKFDLIEAECAGYRNSINWNVSCFNCARLLDSAVAETFRAEKAEEQRDEAALKFVDQLTITELGREYAANLAEEIRVRVSEAEQMREQIGLLRNLVEAGKPHLNPTHEFKSRDGGSRCAINVAQLGQLMSFCGKTADDPVHDARSR